jgi:predicted negative regulator of RcsB-dependent stress response
MANHLDLEEQEQLDQLKHFWKQYGNLITGVLLVILLAFASWNGYQMWQKKQSVQASAMFDEVEKVVRTGDVAQAERAFSDMRERFGSAVYTQQAGLMLAKMAYQGGKSDIAKAALTWVASSKVDEGYAAVAKLRLVGVLIESKSYDEASTVLSGSFPAEFAPLVADRKGDIAMAQDKKSDAIGFYQAAAKGFEDRTEYKRLVLVKLSSLGATVDAVN